jgi:PPOX class probable F420-dependent enzyme
MGISLDEAFGFVVGHSRGVLVTLRRDGRPQLSNILYHPGAENSIRISITDDRAKTKNLRRDPRASLHVTRDDFYAYVVLEGEVALSSVAAAVDDPVVEELVDMYRQARGEHPDWDDYRAEMVKQGRLVATLNATRAYGMLGP